MNTQSGNRERSGRRRVGRGAVAVGALVALLLVACDGSSGTDSTTTTSPDTSVVTSPTSTTSIPTTTTTPSTTVTVDTSLEVLQTWDAFWQEWTAVRASETLNPAPLEEVASPDVAAGVITLFEGQREAGSGPVVTDVVTHPKVTELGPDQAEVEDCVLLSPSFTETVGVWYRAELTNSGSGWTVTDLAIPSLGGCVPQQMATEAIAGYEAYYNAEAEFWDPPDPDHPLLGEVLVDPQLGFVVDLLEEHQSRGVALRGQPTTHPEVTEVRGPEELVILSCLEPAPDFGLYELETGDRLSEVPPVSEGQRDLESAVMVFDGDRWKVSDLQGQIDFECEFAPTERGLPSV